MQKSYLQPCHELSQLARRSPRLIKPLFGGVLHSTVHLPLCARSLDPDRTDGEAAAFCVLLFLRGALLWTAQQ